MDLPKNGNILKIRHQPVFVLFLLLLLIPLSGILIYSFTVFYARKTNKRLALSRVPIIKILLKSDVISLFVFHSYSVRPSIVTIIRPHSCVLDDPSNKMRMNGFQVGLPGLVRAVLSRLLVLKVVGLYLTEDICWDTRCDTRRRHVVPRFLMAIKL